MTACRRLSLRAALATAVAVLLASVAAEAQDDPTLRLAVAPGLAQQVEEAPGELSWTEIPRRLSVEFPSSGALGLQRIPVRLVAVAVRNGEVAGEARTSPALVEVGGSVPATEMAGTDWPPAGDWFPSPRWRATAVSTGAPVPPEPERVASAARVVPDGAGALILYAAPAATSLLKRFLSVPVVLTTRPTGPATDSGPTPPDSTGG